MATNKQKLDEAMALAWESVLTKNGDTFALTVDGVPGFAMYDKNAYALVSERDGTLRAYFGTLLKMGLDLPVPSIRLNANSVSRGPKGKSAKLRAE